MKYRRQTVIDESVVVGMIRNDDATGGMIETCNETGVGDKMLLLVAISMLLDEFVKKETGNEWKMMIEVEGERSCVLFC